MWFRRFSDGGASPSRRSECRIDKEALFGEIWLVVVFMNLPLSVPLIHLVVLMFGTATFTHLFHRGTSGPFDQKNQCREV